MDDDNAVLTAEEAAQLLQVSTKTLLRLAREGELPGRKIGREWRFARSELLEVLAPTAASLRRPPSLSPTQRARGLCWPGELPSSALSAHRSQARSPAVWIYRPGQRSSDWRKVKCPAWRDHGHLERRHIMMG